MFTLLVNIFQSMPAFMGEHPILFWGAIIVGVVSAGIQIFSVHTLKKEGDLQGKDVGVIGGAWLALSNIFPILCFVMVDYVIALGGVVLGPVLYIEIIVFAAVYGFLNVLGNALLGNAEGVKTGIITSVICIVLSLIFMFTGLEDGMLQWGANLFGKQFGVWIFNGYIAFGIRSLMGIVGSIPGFFSNYSKAKKQNS